MKSDQKTRRAVTFDRDLLDYLDEMAGARNQSFSAVCASMLREIMRDDQAAERVAH